MSEQDFDLFSHKTIDLSTQVAVGNSLRSHGEFMIDLGELINSVKVHNPDLPERTQHDFNFIPELMDEKLIIPASIKYYCDVNEQPDLIVLSISQEADEPSCASLEMHFGSKILLVSRDSSVEDGTASDTVLEVRNDGKDVVHTIERVPIRDINALVLHLMPGTDQSTRPQLEKANVFSAIVCESLAQNMPDYAHSWSQTSSYLLGGERSISWTTEAIDRQEQLKTCQITYETGQSGRKVIADVDMENGFRLTFSTLDNGEKETLLPDDGDLLRFQEIVDELRQQFSDTETDDADEATNGENRQLVNNLGNTAITFLRPQIIEALQIETSSPDAQFMQDEA